MTNDDKELLDILLKTFPGHTFDIATQRELIMDNEQINLRWTRLEELPERFDKKEVDNTFYDVIIDTVQKYILQERKRLYPTNTTEGENKGN